MENPLVAFYNFLNTGGFAMWILLVMSIVSIGIVFERFFFFSRQHSDPTQLLKEIGDRVARDAEGCVRGAR